MKKTVGIIGALAILLGCFVNLAFATDVNMIPYEGTAKMEKVEITSETSVRLAEDEMPFFSRESESVRLTDLESKVLKDTQLIVNDRLHYVGYSSRSYWKRKNVLFLRGR